MKERIPFDTALLESSGWLIRLRFLAVLGVALAFALSWLFVPGELPLLQLLILALLVLLYNVQFLFCARSLRLTPTETVRLRLATRFTYVQAGLDLLALAAEERAHRGVFLAMQYPVELPGVNNMVFMKTALNAVRAARGEPALDAVGFMQRVREKLALVEMDERFLKRNVNAGFSGGEKKRNEILQMAVLEPKLAILDETDSGLDIDALRVVADGVNTLRSPERAMIVVTHYQRLLDYIQPDFVHVLAGGRIVRSGDRTLALELEEKGYGWLEQEDAA